MGWFYNHLSGTKPLVSFCFLALGFSSLWADPTPTPAPDAQPTPLPTPPALARYKIAVESPALLTSVEINFPVSSWHNLPFRVFTETGDPVGSDLLWAEPDGPTTLVFDSSSGAKTYNVFVNPNWDPLHITDSKAGVWLETRSGDGEPINSLAAMQQKWAQSQPVQGRALTNGIFEGGNRFGVEQRLLLHFIGWFEAKEQEHLSIMTVSNDSSFVLVDGKEVVELLGHHPYWDSIHGQYQGSVDLAPGTHSLEYYLDYPNLGDHWPVLGCVAAKGGPLGNWTMLNADAHFFKPAGRAHVIDYESKPNGYSSLMNEALPPASFEYRVMQQSIISPDNDSMGLIDVSLCAFPATGLNYTWLFDDGSTATGAIVNHTFLRPGERAIILSVKDATGRELGSVRKTVRIHPEWAKLTSEPQLIQNQRDAILASDLTKDSASDLGDCVDLFANYNDIDALVKTIPVLIPKLPDVADADLAYLEMAATELDDATPEHEKICEALLPPLITRCTAPGSSPALDQIASESRLKWGSAFIE